MTPALPAVMTLLLCGLTIAQARADDVLRGDVAWASRAVGERDGIPAPAAARTAVDAYGSALQARPSNLEARWKLLRALHFTGDFTAQSAGERIATFERGRLVAEAGLDQLARRANSEIRLDELDRSVLRARLREADVQTIDAARLHFWAAIHWAAWGREVGLLSSVRQGLANRLHRYVQVAIALEPEYDQGGPLRLLARLHAQLPRVPFLSGWVERGQAVPLLERAHRRSPQNPGNRFLLALTLLELEPERRAEALALLKQVEGLTPRDTMRIEDLSLRKQASQKLAVSRPPSR